MRAIDANVRAILGTRASVDPMRLAGLGLQDSFLAFGLPDLSGHDPRTPSGRAAIAEAIAAAIRRGEPRLGEVAVVEARQQQPDAVVVHLRGRLRGLQGGGMSIRAALTRDEVQAHVDWSRER